jgi:selenocysteine lyase/cysteine desulfurase
MKLSNLNQIRDKFPITQSKIFLNHAAYSPPSQRVVDAIGKYNVNLCRYDAELLDWSLGQEFFAELISADKDDVALVQNTSTGLNIVANMLNYPKGSNIVTTDLEYPSVVYPWLGKRLDVEVRYVKNVEGIVRIEDVEKTVDDKTVAVAISHVEYVNGFKNDLRRLADIAHEHGAFLVVDGIQSLGAVPVDVRKDEVDFLAASCYKWLMGPAGAGYLYVRKDLVEELEPQFIGWASVRPEVFDTIEFWDIWQLNLSNTASRFEIGSPSFISFVGAAVAIQLLLEVGIANIQKRILSLTDLLIDSAKDMGFQVTSPEDLCYRSGIVHFLIDHAQEKADELKQKGIIVSPRSHGLRVSPHFYNTEEEIEHLMTELKNQ